MPTEATPLSPPPDQPEVFTEPITDHPHETERIDRRSITSAQNGRNSPETGRKPSPIPLDTAVEAAALSIVENQGRSLLAENCGLSVGDARKIRAITGLTPAEFNERVAAKIDTLLDAYLDRLNNEFDDVPLTHLSISFGILNDHRMRLRGLSTPQASHVTNIQINGVDRGSALALLSPSAQRAVSAIASPLARAS